MRSHRLKAVVFVNGYFKVMVNSGYEFIPNALTVLPGMPQGLLGGGRRVCARERVVID
jgi:hypothetical protein